MTKFAFLAHLRSFEEDVAKVLPRQTWLASFFKDRYLDSWARRNGRRGFKVQSHFDVYGKVEGYIILLWLTGYQMLSLPRKKVKQRILESSIFAQNELGVEVLGLGAYTAPITKGGLWLARHPAINLSITHGDSFSAGAAINGITETAQFKKIDLHNARIAVVGAYGLIGEVISEFLAQICDQLILVGRRKEGFNKLFSKISRDQVKISTDLQDVKEADFIITATTGETSILKPEHLKQGAVIYDIAQPVNLQRWVCQARPDITRVDGGFVQIPDINLKFDMELPAGTTFACLAETIMQALEGDTSHHVGPIKIDHVRRTLEWAEKYHFNHAPLTNFSQALTEEVKIDREIYQPTSISLKEITTALKALEVKG